MKVVGIADGWVAFSPASGGTQLLNDAAAAILEVLSESPRTLQEVARAIARDLGQPLAIVDERLQGSFSLLEAAGLIEEDPQDGNAG